jgi:Protein of unknown function (DUF3052)
MAVVMAGYSGTPLVKKLGINEGHWVVLIDAPVGFDGTLGELPKGVKVAREVRGKGAVDVVLLFTKSRKDLERRFMKVAAGLNPDGGLWVAWPKKASGVPTDMTENVVRDVALPKGLVDNKVCAIDDTWSGLRLVYRLENRPAVDKGATTKTKKSAKRTPSRPSR